MLRILAALLALSGPALGASTIDPGVPSPNAPLSSAPVRNNFVAARNDINNILGCYQSTSAPNNPVVFQLWCDTTGAPTAVTVKQWDGSQWLPIWTVNQSAHFISIATTSLNASNVVVANDVATNANKFLAWVDANTGNNPIKVSSTKLFFNPSTGTLESTLVKSETLTTATRGITGHGDSVYGIAATDRWVYTNAAFTAARVWTLPAASAFPPGQILVVTDLQGTVTGSNTLTIARAGSDTINGTTTAVLSAASTGFVVVTDGVSKWTAQLIGAQPGSGTVTSVATTYPASGGTITSSGTITSRFPTTSGRLSYVSTTAVSFAPRNGDLIKINGTLFQIPSAGIAGCTGVNSSVFVNGVGASSVASSTLYYVYAFSNGGTATCDFSTTAHSASATANNVGTEIKTGDDTRSLIGMVRTDNAGLLVNTAVSRLVRSWFNDPGINLQNTTTGSSTSSTSYSEINSSVRLNVLTWTGETLRVFGFAACSNNSVAGSSDKVAISFNGGAQETTSVVPVDPGVANHNYPFQTTSVKDGLTEGLNYATLVYAAGQGTFACGSLTMQGFAQQN